MQETIEQFLDDSPRIGYLSTIDLQGFPHTVPVWFMRDGDDLITSATNNRARIKHISHNPKVSITVGGNSGDSAGYLFQGEFRQEPDPEQQVIRQLARHYLGEEAVEPFLASMGTEHERFTYRLRPNRVVKVWG